MAHNITIDNHTYTNEVEDVDEVGDYYFTKEYKLKRCIMDGRYSIEESVHQNLKNAGFNTLYDIIENPEGVLKAISTNNKEDIRAFRRTVCINLQFFGLLPFHFSPRLVFRKCVIKKIRNTIRKDKLKILKGEDFL